MLAYLSRTLPIIARATLGRDGRLVSRLTRRVMPSQIDINMHMNQAVYAQAMELGRTDWVIRCGAWDRWRSRGVNPVVAEQKLIYRRELKPLAKYVVDSRAVAVDGRLLRFESHLLVGDVVHTRGEAALIFIGPDGVLTPEAVAELCSDFLTEPLAHENWRVVG